MASGVSAGHETRVNYLHEDNGFASSPNDSTYKTFGANVQANRVQGENAVRRVFMPGQRTAIDKLAMLFEGAWAVQFTLENPWWLRSLLGAPSTSDNGDGSHDHTYNGTDPDSIQIEIGYEQDTSNRILKGCVATRTTIDVTVEEEVQVTLEGAYADEELDESPGSLTSQTQPTSGHVLTFAEGSLKLAGSTESYVQSMTLTLEANVDLIREMGSRIAIDYNPKVLAPSADFDELYDGDHGELQELYGGSSETSPQEEADDDTVKLEMEFDNGVAAGSGINKHVYEVTGTIPDSYDERGIGDPRADLESVINRVGDDFNATVTNETATAV